MGIQPRKRDMSDAPASSSGWTWRERCYGIKYFCPNVRSFCGRASSSCWTIIRYTNIYPSIHTYTYLHIHIHIHISIHTYTCLFVYMHVCIYIYGGGAWIGRNAFQYGFSASSKLMMSEISRNGKDVRIIVREGRASHCVGRTSGFIVWKRCNSFRL